MTALETTIAHLRHATRSLVGRPTFTLVAVITLGLGIGANTAIFSVVNAVLLRPLPYEAPDRLVMLWRTAPEEGVLEGFTSYPDFRDWREQSASFSALAAFWTFANGDVNLTGGTEPERVPVARVMSGYFEMLGAAPLHGRTFLPEENVVGNHRRIILSYGLWQRQFGGDPSIVGRPVAVNGFPYEVVGIMPAHFRPLSAVALKSDVAMWRPLAPDDNQTGGRASRNLRVVGRLAPGVTLAQAQAEMDGIADRLANAYAETNRDSGVRLVPLREQIVREARVALLFLLGAVGLVLLGACVNVASLMLVKATGVKKQMAIQLALGATRRRIVARLLTESLLLGLVGGTFGLLLAYAGVEALKAVGPQDYPLLADVNIDGVVLIVTGIVAVGTSVLFGLVPALRFSRPGIATFLREGGQRSSSRVDRRITGSLVVIEIALAMVLLIASGLFVRSFQSLLDADPGLDPANVLTLQIELPMATTYPTQGDRDVFFRDLLSRMDNLREIEMATIASGAPVEEQSSDMGFRIAGREGDPSLRANFRMVGPEYFAMLGIPIIQGRALVTEDDRNSPRVILVSEALARFVWGDTNPVGESVGLPFGPDAAIVGVAGDVRTNGLDGDLTRIVYLSTAQWGFNFMTVLAKTSQNAVAVAPAIRRIIREMDDQLPVYNVRTMDELVARSVAQQRFQMLLVNTFGLLALALALVGIYGVVSYTVTERTAELGLRIALGATPGDVCALVLRQGAKFAVLGVVVGALGAAALSRATSPFLFNVSPLDVATFTVTPLLLIAAALAATYVPARRATKVDPLQALRAE